LLKQLGERAVKKDGAWLALERKDDGPIDLLASRLEVLGPVTESQLSSTRALQGSDGPGPNLLALEGQGRILRGRFTPGTPEVEWCDRRLLARIHRYTLSRLRAEIEPVSAAEFLRFLLHWQHVAGEDQVRGVDGLAAVVEQLEGFELAAGAWEHDVLPSRVADYGGEQLDQLCLSGRVMWGRLTPGTKAALRTSPIALLRREHASQWVSGAHQEVSLSSEATAVRDALTRRGASFFHELVSATNLLPAFVERALAELAGAGIATADSFAGLRALLAQREKRRRAIERAGTLVAFRHRGTRGLRSRGARAPQTLRRGLSRAARA
jgi:ATP-dependent Lhr-like helicase